MNVTNEKISEIAKLIENKSKEAMIRHIEIIEEELKRISKLYKIPPEKLTIQNHPGGIYKIVLTLSQFQIKHIFEGIEQ